MNHASKNRTRSGVSLVEMMVSVLLLFIVFCSWAAMNNIQAVRKESLRYAAVEKAAGMLDAMVEKQSFEGGKLFRGACYKVTEEGKFQRTVMDGKPGSETLYPLWPDDPSAPIYYKIVLTNVSGTSAWTNGTWGVVSLYSPVSGGRMTQFWEVRMLVDTTGRTTR